MMTSPQVTAELNPSLTTHSQMPVLQGVGVSKSVEDATGKLSILSNVDLTLSQGQTMAIVGASGSGKSTLLSILAGLDTPSSGQVLLAGQDLFALDEDARAAWRGQHLGFVFQNFQLLPHLTALENVMLPLELASRKDARSAAADMLGRVGLSSRLRHYPKVMSGGEQQRVALARAFVMRPTLLMADEPTGSLDFATGESVMQLMFALNAEVGTTLLLVTHDQSIAKRCQQTLTLAAGQVVLPG
jgi:putative ABC transport system ATP-binding protein